MKYDLTIIRVKNCNAGGRYNTLKELYKDLARYKTDIKKVIIEKY